MNRKKLIFSLVENFIFIFIIMLIFYIIPNDKSLFLNLNIHPLFFIVLIMGLRYGSVIALMSAVFSSFIYGYVYFTLDKDMFLLFSDLSNNKYFIYFFLVAVIIGRFKDNFVYHEELSKNKINLLLEANENLKKSNKELLVLKNELKKQIIGAEYSILSLYDIALSLEAMDEEVIYTETMGILKKFLNAKTISIYSVNKEKRVLRLKIRMGEESSLPNSIFYNDENEYHELIEKKKIIKHTHEIDDDCPLLCAPIVDEGIVIAILNVEGIEFEFLTEYTLNIFKIIVEWVNKSLVRAIRAKKRKKNNIYYENTEAMYFSDFLERVRQEEKRRKKFGIDYLMLSYNLKNADLNIISYKSKEILREVDIVGFKCSYNDIEYIDKRNLTMEEIIEKINIVSSFKKKNKIDGNLFFLLPATPLYQKERIEERILSAFNYKLEKVYEEKY